jgi:putative addiction module antidote
MATVTKIVAIGNSAGIILPKETLARLNIRKGDTVYLSEAGGNLQVSPYDEEFAAKMDVAGEMVRRYRDAFKRLAE